MKFRRHVFQDEPWDPVRPRRLVVWGAAECLVHNDGVMCPAIIGTDEVGVARTEARQGNGAPGGRVGSGESAFVSSSASFRITACGSVMRIPSASSLMMERSVGSVLDDVLPAAVRRRDLRAPFGRLTNILSRVEPYSARRTVRACLSRSLIAFRRLLKQACAAGKGGIAPLG